MEYQHGSAPPDSAELDALIGLVDGALDPDEMLSQVATIAQYDRYQASHGLSAAAAQVAEFADRAGLRQVSTTTYPADGELHWWTWRAPVSWTPERAELTVRDGSGSVVAAVSHASSPFTIATYSAPIGPATLPIVRLDSGQPIPRGALVYVPAARWQHGAAIAELAEAGAAGFVTAAPAVELAGRHHPGRIELPPRSAVFGFSVVPEIAAMIEQSGVRAEVTVALASDTAPMTVTSAALPGSAPELPEVWLVAHLCHPRPGGNDNASGVAALLGIAATLAKSIRSGLLPPATRTIRFLWGPEFLGPVAALSDQLAAGRPAPTAVVDLDVVGVDQSRFDVPFVVELPFRTADPLGTLAIRAVRSAFRRTADQPGRWRTEPFTGFSDHAIFADPRLGSTAVQLCHVGDPANHSAADRVELVSAVELRRAALAGATIARTVAEQSSADRPDIAQQSSTDPLDIARTPVDIARTPAGERSCTHPADECAALRRAWDGPLNVREMVARVPAETGRALRQLLGRDKRLLSVLLNLGLSADSPHCHAAVLERLSSEQSLSLEAPERELLIAAFTGSGWAKLAPILPITH